MMYLSWIKGLLAVVITLVKVLVIPSFKGITLSDFTRMRGLLDVVITLVKVIRFPLLQNDYIK